MNQDLFVGLDIGTTKVCAVVAVADPLRKTVDIIGAGIAPCDGLKRGVVTNIGKTAESVRQAIDKAEQQSGYTINNVVVGIAGDHIATSQTRAIVTVSSNEISQSDVNRLHHELRQVRIMPDRQILHVIPQDYIIDGQEGISDPMGMSGKRLEANALVITASASAVENIYRCAERAGIVIDDIVLQPLASAYAVLDEAEKEVGVALIDIGGGTSDVAVFKDNVLRFANIVSIAGQKVTDDIVAVLGIRNVDAERIKREHGHADAGSIMRDEQFQIPGVGGRTPTQLSKSILCQIIEPRVEEIYEHSMSMLMESGWAHQLSAGVVVTGGCSMLRGSDALAQRLFRMPVNIGIPRGFSSEGLAKEVSSPVYATAVGLALYSHKHTDDLLDQRHEEGPMDRREQHSVDQKGFMTKIKDWFENL
jgi:cell division protein FtsA